MTQSTSSDACMKNAASLGDAQVDGSQVDLVMLDMDGTILDLAYDNYFWRTLVFERYAALHGISRDEADARLLPEFIATQHTLPWYCTDHWSRVTGLDMLVLKAEIRERIRPLPGAVAFLDAVRASGRGLWLVTNAHPDTWRLKLSHTGLQPRFDRIVSSHEFGAPKEHPAFWRGLRAAHAFDPARTLFVDDSKAVLDAARAYGIGQVIGIRHPDHSAPPRPVEGHDTVDALAHLTLD
jgi:5'-nucleotidase